MPRKRKGGSLRLSWCSLAFLAWPEEKKGPLNFYWYKSQTQLLLCHFKGQPSSVEPFAGFPWLTRSIGGFSQSFPQRRGWAPSPDPHPFFREIASLSKNMFVSMTPFKPKRARCLWKERGGIGGRSQVWGIFLQPLSRAFGIVHHLTEFLFPSQVVHSNSFSTLSLGIPAWC